jgi:TonB family protein
VGHRSNPSVKKARPLRERRIGRFLLIALVVHAELLLLLGLGAYWMAPRDADVQARLAADKEPESIDIGMLDDDAARRIVADLERQDEQRKAAEVKKEVDSVKPPGQVVDVPAPREEKRPDQARFASEHDTTVERETRKYGKFDPQARQGDATGAATQSRPETPPAPNPSPTPPPLLAMRLPRPTPGRADDARAGEQPSPAGSERGAPDREAPDPEGLVSPLGKSRMQLGVQGMPGGPLSLMPTPAQLARAVGSGTQDALKDIDDGEETALNSKKWRFASFFNRVKKQVQEQWRPDEVYRRRDPNGTIYGHTSRLTIIRVQLKPNGRLANVELEQPSGLEFLDDEALRAFRAAQPFPNPPAQLVDASDGTIKFQFGFLFELSGVSKPLLFKYNM